MSKIKRRTKKKAHPEAPKPFAGIREVIFNAFAKIGSPIDNTDVLHIERKSAGVRVEVVKTISFLTHKQMMKLLGLIRFKSVRLSRFRISAATHKGKACLRFLFFVQGVRAGSVTADAQLAADVAAATDFLAKRTERPAHMNTHASAVSRLSSFFELVTAIQERDPVEVTSAMSAATRDAVEKMRTALKREKIAARVLGGKGDPNSFQVIPDTPNGSFNDHAVFFIANVAKEAGCTYVQGMPIVVREAVGGKGFTFYTGYKPRPYRPPATNREAAQKFHDERWAAYKKGGGTVEASVKRLSVKAGKQIRLQIFPATPDDVADVRAALAEFASPEAGRGYPKVKRITQGSNSGKMLVAFGRPMSPAEMLKASRILSRLGWFASADYMLRDILGKSTIDRISGWNGDNQLTIFKGQHV